MAPYNTLLRGNFLVRFQIDADVHRLNGRYLFRIVTGHGYQSAWRPDDIVSCSAEV